MQAILGLAADRRRFLGLGALVVVGLFGLAEIGGRLLPADAASARIEVWHGERQKVGHLGDGQDDFNLMGRIEDPRELLSLQYTLGPSIPVELNWRAYRRVALDGTSMRTSRSPRSSPAPTRSRSRRAFGAARWRGGS
jgi:hypothetical protein